MHVFVKKSKHVGLPNVHAGMEKVVAIVLRVANRRIDRQAMRLPELLAAGVQHLAGREGVIVLGVNEEDGRSDVVVGGQEPRSQLRRTIKAVAGSGKDHDRPQARFTFGEKHRERASKRVADRGDIPRIDVRERPQEFESGQGVLHFPVFQQLQLQRVACLLPVCGRFTVHQVCGVCALVRGRPDATPEQVQEYIAMACEDRSEYFGVVLVRSKAFQIFAGTAAAVIQQDCGNGPRPCGRQSIACRVAEPLWTSTVSGPPELWHRALEGAALRKRVNL